MPITPLQKRVVFLVLILALITLLSALDLRQHLTFAQLRETREFLEHFYAAYRITAIAGFVALYLVLSALAVPGPLVLSVLAGAVFGIVHGAMYTSIGAAIGASMTFLAGRYLFRSMLREKLGARLERINAELDNQGWRHLLFMRLVPIFPFSLVSLAAAMTTMPLRIFFMGTLVGVIPPNLILANAGASMATITGANDIFTFQVIGALSLLGSLAVAPVIAKKIGKRWGR